MLTLIITKKEESITYDVYNTQDIVLFGQIKPCFAIRGVTHTTETVMYTLIARGFLSLYLHLNFFLWIKLYYSVTRRTPESIVDPLTKY